MLTTRSPGALTPSPATIRQALTPRPSSSAPPAPDLTTVSPSPGRFQHPKLREIVQRQSKSSFTSKDFNSVVVNAVCLVGTFIASDTINATLKTLATVTTLRSLAEHSSTLLLVTRLVLLLNILLSLRPILPRSNPYLSMLHLTTPEDSLPDIPLTPSQRALLGLPSSTTSTPTSAGIITPPRYRRTSGSPGPSADRRSVSANYGSSPATYNNNSPLNFPTPPQSQTRGWGQNSPIGSPLLQRALTQRKNDAHMQRNSFTGGMDEQQQQQAWGESTLSYSEMGGSLRRSQSAGGRKSMGMSTSTFVPDTPSPGSREREKRAVGGVNYKWLYEKGY